MTEQWIDTMIEKACKETENGRWSGYIKTFGNELDTIRQLIGSRDEVEDVRIVGGGTKETCIVRMSLYPKYCPNIPADPQKDRELIQDTIEKIEHIKERLKVIRPNQTEGEEVNKELEIVALSYAIEGLEQLKNELETERRNVIKKAMKQHERR